MKILISLALVLGIISPVLGSSLPGSLSSVFVYPNPIHLSLGDSFMTFANMPAYTVVDIFNTSGIKVRSLTGSAAGVAIWTGTNTSGQVLPDDVYYAVITDTLTQTSGTLFLMKEIGGAGQTVTRNIPAMTPKTETVRNYDISGNYVGDTALVIRGTESGSVSAMGGIKGFVNPMNGEKLTIGYKATGPGTIKTKIFDSKGRLVREFSVIAGGTEAGSLQWDVRDAGGKMVSSGVYLIHVEGPGINTTKRTVILK